MIRRFEACDRDDVRALLLATGNFSPAEVAIAEELMDTIITRPGQTDYYGFVCPGAADDVAGFLIIGPAPATLGTWHMYWIAVDPRFYGAGIAQELDTFAEAFVTDRGGYWLIAETSGQAAYVRARSFYSRQHYRELVRIPDYYKPGDDMLMFGKRLAGG